MRRETEISIVVQKFLCIYCVLLILFMLFCTQKNHLLWTMFSEHSSWIECFLDGGIFGFLEWWMHNLSGFIIKWKFKAIKISTAFSNNKFSLDSCPKSKKISWKSISNRDILYLWDQLRAFSSFRCILFDFKKIYIKNLLNFKKRSN